MRRDMTPTQRNMSLKKGDLSRHKKTFNVINNVAAASTLIFRFDEGSTAHLRVVMGIEIAF